MRPGNCPNALRHGRCFGCRYREALEPKVVCENQLQDATAPSGEMWYEHLKSLDPSARSKSEVMLVREFMAFVVTRLQVTPATAHRTSTDAEVCLLRSLSVSLLADGSRLMRGRVAASRRRPAAATFCCHAPLVEPCEQVPLRPPVRSDDRAKGQRVQLLPQPHTTPGQSYIRDAFRSRSEPERAPLMSYGAPAF